MNKRFIIILGTSFLIIIFTLGISQYYQERKSQESALTPDDIINYVEPTFNRNYPVSLEEADTFQKSCAIAATPGKINKGIITEQTLREVFCFLGKKGIKDENKYMLLRMLVKDVPTLHKGQYIGIAVNYSDLLQKNVSTVPSDSSFNLCTITKPVLLDHFKEQLFKDQINLNRNIRNIVFSEGEVFCNKFFGLPNERINLLINGFVPSTNLFQAEMYLVSEDAVVNQLLSQESLANIEDILQSYPLLWNVEKPVI